MDYERRQQIQLIQQIQPQIVYITTIQTINDNTLLNIFRIE